MFFQALFISSLSVSSRKLQTWFRSYLILFPTSSSLRCRRLNLSNSKFCVACFLTANLSLTFATTRYSLVSQSAPLKLGTSSILECHLLPTNMWSLWLWVFPSGEVQVYLCLGVGTLCSWPDFFFYVAEFTILTPLSLLSWCRLYYQLSVWKYSLSSLLC